MLLRLPADDLAVTLPLRTEHAKELTAAARELVLLRLDAW
jgi:hypothetical protein